MIDDYNICPTQSKDSPANHVRLAEGLQELGYRPTYFSTWRSVVEAGWRCPWESYIPSDHFSVPWFWLAECVRKRAHIPLTIFFLGPMRLIFHFMTVWNQTWDWKQSKPNFDTPIQSD